MIEKFGRGKIRMLKCPICETNLRSTLPAIHLWQSHSPDDVGLQTHLPEDRE